MSPQFPHIANTNPQLEIGYNEVDKIYFVYHSIGLRLIVFIGTYTQCLIVIGGVSLGDSIDKSVEIADSLNKENK